MKRRLLASEFIKLLNGREIAPLNYNSGVFVQTSGWNNAKYFKKYYKKAASFPIMLIVKENEGIMIYPIISAALTKEIFENNLKSKNASGKIGNQFSRLSKIINEGYKKLSYSYVEKTPHEVLIKEATSIKDAAWEMNALALSSLNVDKKIFWQMIEKNCLPITKKRLDQIWEKATDSVALSFDKRRRTYYLKLLCEKKDSGDIAQKCQYFFATYNHIADIEETKGLLRNNYKIKNLKKELQIMKKEQQERLNDYVRFLSKLKKEEKKLVEFVQKMIELRDIRKDYISKMSVTLYRIAGKLFEEADVPKKLIKYYTFDELKKGKKYLEKNKNLIAKRAKGFLVLVLDDEIKKYQYGNFEENKKMVADYQLGENINLKKIEIIKGQSACRGKVRGKVRVILDINSDSSKFIKGEILVTNMTRPEYVLLMKKASAIVTDEGGVTSHAAIVSRELKIPCIIGTKIATQVLKTGDLVEVDADRGIVKILEK